MRIYIKTRDFHKNKYARQNILTGVNIIKIVKIQDDFQKKRLNKP